MNDEKNVLARFRDASGKEVSVDYFLYSCWEQEDLLRRGGFLERPTDQGDLRPVKAKISSLFEHYAREFPELSSPETVDFSRLDEVVKPVVKLTHAMMNELSLTCTVPLEQQLKDIAPEEFWREIDVLTRQYFPALTILLQRFLQWTLSTVEEEMIVPGSRPPIGRFAPRFRKAPLSGPPSQGSGRPRDGVRSAGPRRGDHPANGRGESGRRRHGNSADQSRGRERSKGGSRRGASSSERISKETELMLREDVLDAIALIKAGQSSTVTLKPRNSFHRRLQHEMVKSEGFESYSTGEGKDRAITISTVPGENNE